jgi:hypothetical protein
MAGDSTLTRPCRTVNGYYEVPFALKLLGRIFRVHPRFFVPCLVRLLKNRLPLAAVRPAAAREGRLLRAERVSFRADAGFPFADPVRLLHEGVEGLPLL